MITRSFAGPQGLARSVRSVNIQSSSSSLSPLTRFRFPRSLTTDSYSAEQAPRTGYSVPLLSNNKGSYFNEHGIPGFMSPRTYKSTWLAYQEDLVKQLDTKVAGTAYDGASPWELHVNFSRDPQHVNLYNIAAMCHFNHFWWDSLSPVKTDIPSLLASTIESQFGSVDALRDQMLEAGDAMFGNGFVWLMKERGVTGTGGKLRVLCTYNAGSPYAKAWRMRQEAMPTNAVGLNRYSRDPDLAPNALVAQPVLCLNVWQHMWVPDYGLTNKRMYLSSWWERIDWEKAFQRFSQMQN